MTVRLRPLPLHVASFVAAVFVSISSMTSFMKQCIISESWHAWLHLSLSFSRGYIAVFT